MDAVTDTELAHLREQALFMSLGGQASGPSWLKVASALTELQNRRAKDSEFQEVQSERRSSV